MNKVIVSIYALIGVCSVLFSAFAPELIRLLAGKKYMEAIYVVPPVAVSMYFSFMYTIFANVELFYNKNKFTMYISLGGALLNIGLNYIFINLFNYIAAGYTTLACYIIFSFSHYIYMVSSVKKELGVDHIFNTKLLIIISAVVLLCGILVVILYPYIILRYCFILLVGIISFIFRKRIINTLKSIKKPAKLTSQ